VFPLNKLNLVILLKNKLRSLQKTKAHVNQLLQPVDTSVPTVSYLDLHLHKQATFVTLMSLVTQLVIDMLAGWTLMLLIVNFPTFFIDLLDWCGGYLHLENLETRVKWLLGFPAGFKPNLNLAHFMGNCVIEMIWGWNLVTSALT